MVGKLKPISKLEMVVECFLDKSGGALRMAKH